MDSDVTDPSRWTPVPWEHPFAVASLSARAGLSNLVAFFFPAEVVLCDVGTARGLMGRPPGVDVAAWCEAARRKAKWVLVVPDREIRRVGVCYRMMQNQVSIARETGSVSASGYRDVRRAAPEVLRYSLLDREETEPAARNLAARFGARFELSTTRAYAFVHRFAPVLTR
jgi:hypothetical protein